MQQFIIKIISTDLNQYNYLKYIKYKTLLMGQQDYCAVYGCDNNRERRDRLV